MLLEILIDILDTIAAVFLEHIIAHLANPSAAAFIVNPVPARIQAAGRVLPAVRVTVIPEVRCSIRIILVQVFHGYAGVRNGRSEGKTQPNPAGARSGMGAMRG